MDGARQRRRAPVRARGGRVLRGPRAPRSAPDRRAHAGRGDLDPGPVAPPRAGPVKHDPTAEAQGRGGARSFHDRAHEAIQLALRDVSAAGAVADELLREAGDDPERRAYALVAQAHARAYEGRFVESIGLLREAEGVCTRAQVALVASVMVQPLMMLGKSEEAHAAGSRAAEAAEEAGDHAALAKALVNLGAVERSMGRSRQAEATLVRAERIAGEHRAIAAAAMSNRAESLLDQDRFGEALSCLAQAAEVFEGLGRGHAAAIVHGNRADVLGRLGQVEEAMQAFERARGCFEATQTPLDVARLMCEEAEMLAQAGALRAARDRYASSLPRLEAGLAAPDLRRARVAFGAVLLELGDAEGALEQIELAAAIGEGSSPLMGAEIELGRGRCALERGEVGVASAHAVAAVEGLREAPARRVRALKLLARVRLAQGLGGEAIEAADEALGLAQRVPLESLVPLCRALLGRCYAASGDAGMRREHLRAACQEARVVLGQTFSGAAASGLRRAYAPLVQEHAEALLDDADSDPAEAHDALLSAALLRAPVGGPTPQGGVDAGLMSRLARVSERIARAASVAGPGAATQDRRSLAELHAEQQVLMDRAGVRGVVGQDRARSAAQVGAALPEGHAVVQWFAEGDRLSALVIRRGASVVARGVVEARAVSALAGRAIFIAERAAASSDGGASDSAWAAVVEGVSSRVLAPVIGALGGAGVQRLMIGGVPETQRLPWGAVAQRAWGDDAPTVVCIGAGPGGARASADRARAGAGASGPGGGNAVVIAADAATLPGVPAEVAAVAGCWPGAAVHVGGRWEACAQSLAGAGVVHIATHGVFEPDRPWATRLHMGDRWVSLRDLAERLRPAATVVLSACHAGRAGGRAEDAAAAPGVLLAAGARWVIAPIWPLRDDRCAAVFGAVHRALARDRNADAGLALRDALRDPAVRQSVRPDTLGILAFGDTP
ncbi:MAG: hypothetical protein C0513_06915 [Isosphaera sp.]|nr:hypothetical protein [Isosphaera sp.]